MFLAISTVLNHSTTAASFGGREGRASGLPAAEPLQDVGIVLSGRQNRKLEQVAKEFGSHTGGQSQVAGLY